MKKSLFLSFIPFIFAACIQTPPAAEPPEPTSEAHDMSEMMNNMPCHQMGDTWMGNCEFDENGNPINLDDGMMMDHSNMHHENGEYFSQETDGLPEAKPSEVVELQDGDTFEMSADMVKQTVGNRVLKRLAYNGQIPGPLLKVPKGAEITIQFTNNIDIDTTIHSHGLRLDNVFDGVPDVTQKPIKPGESFTYQLQFPDEGIYWYHPHIREDYTQELGLYGNFLVEGDEEYWNQVDREEIVILDDIAVNEEGIVPFSLEYTDHTLMGRFGNMLLVNNEENFAMNVKKGEIVRFFITNVANTRTFQIGFLNENIQMKLVGGDIGRIEKEEFVDSIIIAPAERYVVEVIFPESGEFPLQHVTPEKTYQIGTVKVSDETPNIVRDLPLRENTEDYADIRDQFDALLSREPDKKLRLSIDMREMGSMDHSAMGHGSRDNSGIVPTDGIEWADDMVMMNQMSTSENTTWKLIDETTGKENMDIMWKFEKGDLVKIRIFNDPQSMHPMQHPIHFHGQRFVVLSRDGVPNDNLQWKDTTLIRTGETVDILVEMSNLGTWMAHCHIAEHLHAGMMMGFEVKENSIDSDFQIADLVSKKYPNCDTPIFCENIAKINCGAEVDGPLYYLEKNTGDIISTCRGACRTADERQREVCKKLCPPPEWNCS